MKKAFKISFLIAIFLCLIELLSTPSANALSEYYHKDWLLYDSIHGFSYMIEVNIQTEANGKWILDKAYYITYIISITYLNQSFFNPQEFYATFFEPEVRENSWLRDSDIIVNSSYVDMWHSGSLVIRYTPTKTFTHLNETSNTSYYPVFWFKVFKNQQAIPYDYVEWQWIGDHQISITFEKQENPDYLTPTLYTLIGVVIGALPIGIYSVYKFRRFKGEPKNV